MAVESHLAELVARHRKLDLTIDEEMSRPFTDSMLVAELKKKKLHLKEEIERLKGAEAIH
ncbi:MAG: DUF465 domain-containing protein [Flavobacteriaceae bacterium]